MNVPATDTQTPQRNPNTRRYIAIALGGIPIALYAFLSVESGMMIFPGISIDSASFLVAQGSMLLLAGTCLALSIYIWMPLLRSGAGCTPKLWRLLIAHVRILIGAICAVYLPIGSVFGAIIVYPAIRDGGIFVVTFMVISVGFAIGFPAIGLFLLKGLAGDRVRILGLPRSV